MQKNQVIKTTQEIHVSTAQRYALAAHQDGLEEETIRSIASLASWGRHMQNVERDLHRWMPSAHNTELETFTTVIDVYDPDLAQVQQKSMPILLASDVLHSLWRKQNATLWDACIGATAEKCQLYWDYAAEDWASNHPVVQPFGGLPVNNFNFDFPMSHQ